MSNIKFSQLPNLGNLTAATIVPVVSGGVNYTVTAANLQAYTNSTVGNISASYFLGNGSQLTGLPATYSNANVTTLLASFGSNTISTTGNITSGYLFGNGSQLTGIAASYTNANVNTLLSSWGSNTLSTTGNVTSGNLTASGNVTGTYILGNGSLLTGLAGNYGNSNVTTLMAGFGSNTISTTGTVTAGAVSATGNVTAGNVNTGGNVSGNYILGNGSLLTGLAGNYGNPNVVSLLSAFGSNTISTTGNITSGNLNTGGNVTGAFIKGSGSQLTGIVTSISAGTGISINQSTGAVTITATGGGGGGTSISNGTTNISILSASGNIQANVGAYSNVLFAYPVTAFGYPVLTTKSFLSITSQSGGYNTTYGYDGGLQCVGDMQTLSGNLTVGGTGIYGTLRGPVITGSDCQTGGLIASGQVKGTNSNGGAFNAALATKTNSSPGTAGDISWDANYIYVCTATNTWKRVALSTF